MKDYKQKTKKQETDDVFSISTEQLEEIRKASVERVKTTKHEWRQRGVYLVCTSCEFEHAIHIGTGKLYRGLDESGQPKFEELTF